MTTPLDLDALERETEKADWARDDKRLLEALPALVAEVRRLRELDILSAIDRRKQGEENDRLREALARLRPMASTGTACDSHDNDAMVEIIDAALRGTP